MSVVEVPNIVGHSDADISGVTAGTGLTGGGGSGTVTLNVDVGTGPNQIVQLTAASKLPAVDGSLLTGISSTGTANTVALFNSSGALTSDADVGYALSTDSLKFGARIGGGVLGSTGSGSLSHGNVDNTGTINATAAGAKASGNASGGVLNATATGAQSHGHSNGAAAALTASGVGATAFGNVDAGATVLASGSGAFAYGVSDSQTVGIKATVAGAFAGGHAAFEGVSNSVIQATGAGAMSHGHAGEAGSITASGLGAHAFGDAPSASAILASGAGAFATGRGGMTASGNGSFAGGAANGGSIVSSGISAFSHGDEITTSGQWAQSLGIGHTNNSFNCIAVGRYSSISGTTGSYVSSEPAFVVGNGSGSGARNNAFAVRKAGNIDLPSTITAGGTTGDRTINKISGSVNFAAAATAIVVTNSLVTANSIIHAVVQTDDATAVIKSVVPGSGSFTINIVAATAETRVGFVVFN